MISECIATVSVLSLIFLQQVRQQSIDKLMAEKKSEVAKLQRERTTWEKKIKVKVWFTSLLIVATQYLLKRLW